jgi:hypothetical protein
MTKLSDLQIDEVSLVRKGANQHSRVVIAKSSEAEGAEVTYFDEDGRPVEELETIAKSAQAVAEAEREARRVGEFVELAKSYSLPVEDEVLAQVMMHIEDALPPEEVEIVAKCFQAASEALFDEQGAIGGGDNDDVMAKATAAAQSAFSKSGEQDVESLTADYFAKNPEEYSSYTRDHYGYSHGR